LTSFSFNRRFVLLTYFVTGSNRIL